MSGFERVLLTQPSYQGGHYAKTTPLAGLGYVAQALADAGIEYDVIDLNLGYCWDDLAKKIDEFKPDLLGIGLMTFRHRDGTRHGDAPRGRLAQRAPFAQAF